MFLRSLLGTFNPCPVTLLSLLSVLNPVSSPHPPPLLLPFCLQVGWQRLLALRGAQVEELCLLLSIFSRFFPPICLFVNSPGVISSALGSLGSPGSLPPPPPSLFFSLPWQRVRCDVLIRFCWPDWHFFVSVWCFWNEPRCFSKGCGQDQGVLVWNIETRTTKFELQWVIKEYYQ